MHSPLLRRFSLLLVLLLALAIHPAHAGWPKSKPRPTPPHHHIVISTVSAGTISVKDTASDAAGKSYTINATTEITFNGLPTTVDKLSAGMRVSITPDAVDESIAAKITANDPPKDSKAKKK